MHARARKHKRLPPVENAHTQVARIVLRVAHELSSLAAFLSKSEDRRAFLDDAPAACIIARIDLNPFDKIAFRRANFDAVVERRLGPDVENYLRIAAGSKTVLAHCGAQRSCCFRAFMGEENKRDLVTCVVDYAHVRKPGPHVCVNILRDDYAHDSRSAGR